MLRLKRFHTHTGRHCPTEGLEGTSHCSFCEDTANILMMTQPQNTKHEMYHHPNLKIHGLQKRTDQASSLFHFYFWNQTKSFASLKVHFHISTNYIVFAFPCFGHYASNIHMFANTQTMSSTCKCNVCEVFTLILDPNSPYQCHGCSLISIARTWWHFFPWPLWATWTNYLNPSKSGRDSSL